MKKKNNIINLADYREVQKEHNIWLARMRENNERLEGLLRDVEKVIKRKKEEKKK